MNKSEEKHLLVRQWKESGLTQTAYCESIGVKRTTFANRVGRIKKKELTGFLSITPTIGSAPESIELIYPNGVRLTTSGSDKHILYELIRCW
jgi:hypothetical protein